MKQTSNAGKKCCRATTSLFGTTEMSVFCVFSAECRDLDRDCAKVFHLMEGVFTGRMFDMLYCGVDRLFIFI